MRIGLIGRADYTGLGVQTYDFYRHIHPDKVLVMDLKHLNGQASNSSLYPGAQVLKFTPYPDTRKSHPQAITAINQFLDGLDLVFTCETPYDYHLFREARVRGIKTILQYNFEFLDYSLEPDLPQPDLFMAPSLWCYDDVPFKNKVFVPVPVDRNKFVSVPRKEARTFIHVGGTPALEDRNGTQAVLNAWGPVRGDARLIVYTQQGRYVSPDSRVEIRRGTVVDQSEFYVGADVMLMPRKFGGLCLPLNEAMSCALPTIMTDLLPQKGFLHREALVRTYHAKRVMTKSVIDIFEPHLPTLTQKIQQCVDSPELVQRLSEHNDSVAEKISWERIEPIYRNVFEHVVSGVVPPQEFQW